MDLRAPAPSLAPRGRAPPTSPRATRSSRAVPEIAKEQDIAIGLVVDGEAKEEFDFATYSLDEDYQLPIPDLPWAARPRG